MSVDLSGSGAEPLAPGDPRVVGPYRIVGTLGAGRTGKVFLGLDLSLAGSWPGGVRLVAVKAVWPEADDDLLTGFQCELATLGRVPAVGSEPSLSMWDQSPRPRWYATDYIPGVSLAQVAALGYRLPAASAWLLVDQVARAVVASHAAGIAPGDLKPSGVLLTREGAKVVDVGSSRPADRLRLIGAGEQDVSSASFIAPEQVAGRVDLDGAADVFALGALVWFAMAGEPPFGRGPGPEVLARVLHVSPDLGPLRGIDAALADLVEVCLAKDPAARPDLAWLIGRCSEFARGFVGGAAGGAGALRWPGEVMALVEQRCAFVQRVMGATDDTAMLPAVPAAPAAPTPQDPTVALGVPKLSPPPSARPDPMPTLVDATGGALLGAGSSTSAGMGYYTSAPPADPRMTPPQPTAFPAPTSPPPPPSAYSRRYRVEMAASITAAVALILASTVWALHSGGHTTAAGATAPPAPVVITPSAAASDPAAAPSAGPDASDTTASDTPTPTPTPTAANPPGSGSVASGIAGECLAVAGGSTNDGTPAQLAGCDGAPDQIWSQQGGTLQFGGKCLDVSGRATANGTRVQLWSCNGGPNQQWSRRPDGTLVSVQSGRCLDDPSGSTAAGVQLQIWDCHGGGNQTWTLP